MDFPPDRSNSVTIPRTSILSRRLSEFGKGFDARNLRSMLQFYLLFPNWNAVRSNLNWTHYRSLLKVEIESVSELVLLNIS